MSENRCGECRLGLGVHDKSDPYCDHHEPGAERFERAFESLTEASEEIERAERLAEAREFASTARLSQFPPHTIGSLLLALDDEITRLTGLLAERDAAVQRVRALHIQGLPLYPDHIAECDGCRADCEWCEGEHPWPCPTLAALDPQA